MARAPLDRTIEERPRLFFATGFCEEQREGGTPHSGHW